MGTRVCWHIYLLEQSIMEAIWKALTVWFTTPNNALYRKAGIPPVSFILQQNILRFAAHKQRTDVRYPLALQLTKATIDTMWRLGFRSGSSSNIGRRVSR